MKSPLFIKLMQCHLNSQISYSSGSRDNKGNYVGEIPKWVGSSVSDGEGRADDTAQSSVLTARWDCCTKSTEQ